MGKNLYEYRREAIERHPNLEADFKVIEAQCDLIAQIIQRRNELGLTQQQLARKCGMSVLTLARIESGAVSPSFKNFFKIISNLGMNISISVRQ